MLVVFSLPQPEEGTSKNNNWEFINTIAEKLPYSKLRTGMVMVTIIDLVILLFSFLHNLGKAANIFIVVIYFIEIIAYIAFDFIKSSPVKKRVPKK